MAEGANSNARGWSPAVLFERGEGARERKEDVWTQVGEYLSKNDLKSAVIAAFALPTSDDYVYHATASVTLSQVQAAINAGSAHGLHDWYLDDKDSSVGHPPPADVEAYIAIFDPRKSAANTLKSFGANAKKGSIRASVAAWLLRQRHVEPPIVLPKRKAPHVNPYYDFWAWSCRALEYAGPTEHTVRVKTSHHVLPVFMMHLGCVCPSYEALELVTKMAAGREILDVGSGNGYWTAMLRRHSCQVTAIDNQQSAYRTMWIDDTLVGDAVAVLKRRKGAADCVLLMVYPVVSGDFTQKVLEAYRGGTICVAGTQNRNGYTGFKDVVVSEWMERNKKDLEKVVQVPLPSFAGKDDALFVFRQRRV